MFHEKHRTSRSKNSLRTEYSRLLREHNVSLEAIGKPAGAARIMAAGYDADDGQGVVVLASDMAEDIWPSDLTNWQGIYIYLRRTGR
jgi:hypothetical protein